MKTTLRVLIWFAIAAAVMLGAVWLAERPGTLTAEWRGWRVDVGYFLTQNRARQLFPYPSANDRFAGTLSWHF